MTEETGFELETRAVTTEELDAAIIALKKANEDYDLHKKVSTEKYHVASECEAKVLDLLSACGKNNYTVDNVAQVIVKTKSQVTTPKTVEDKEKFFAWLELKFGREGRLAYQSVNANSLNSLYNKEMEAAVERGETLEVPGIELPMVVKTLSVLKK